MAWVRVDVDGLVTEEEAVGVGVRSGYGVGFGAGDTVYLRIKGLHPPKHVVEGAVLLDQNDNRFDRVGAARLPRHFLDREREIKLELESEYRKKCQWWAGYLYIYCHKDKKKKKKTRRIESKVNKREFNDFGKTS